MLTRLEAAGKRRRVRDQEWSRHISHAFRLLLTYQLLRPKLDLTEPRKLYIMNHTVIAAVEETILLYLMLTPLRPRQVGAGYSPTTRLPRWLPRKVTQGRTPRPARRL